MPANSLTHVSAVGNGHNQRSVFTTCMVECLALLNWKLVTSGSLGIEDKCALGPGDFLMFLICIGEA